MKPFRAFAQILLISSAPLTLMSASAGTLTSPELPDSSTLDSPAEAYTNGVWLSGIGEGFRPCAESFTVSAGATYGLSDFGTKQTHDLALTSLTYGHILGRMWCENSCFRGNLEFRLELFGGAQFSPSTEWIVGLTRHLRYNFATATRWVPFVDAGAGVTGTGIGGPDLATTFEFNLQGGAGVQYFIANNVSINLEAWYLHISNAGIKEPNLGLNGITGMLGITFFF